MKAEDTVRLCPTTSQGWRINCDPKCHERQAETTWDTAKQEGRREAIEWISQNIHLVVFPDNKFFDKWQAFLKRLGIEGA